MMSIPRELSGPLTGIVLLMWIGSSSGKRGCGGDNWPTRCASRRRIFIAAVLGNGSSKLLKEEGYALPISAATR